MSKQSSKTKAMEIIKSHSLRRLSTASAPKIAQKCCPIVTVCILRMYYAQVVIFISSFQLYFIDKHIYLSFNVPHLIEKRKTIFCCTDD